MRQTFPSTLPAFDDDSSSMTMKKHAPFGKLTREQRSALLETLRVRFLANMDRHIGVEWNDVTARFEKRPKCMEALFAMEETGGEPDVVGPMGDDGAWLYIDCSPETPKGRVSTCYDLEALESRKEHRPSTSAVEMATEMGITLLTEVEYRKLQEFGEFDRKTSSWLSTPEEIRKLGGALFGDRRFGRVFVYHNGAQSYFAARGFRGALKL